MSQLALSRLFDDAVWRSRTLFIKALTNNDDSGRHGVLVPREAYPLFPPLDASDQANPAAEIVTQWRGFTGWEPTGSYFRQYDRYPERRLTSLMPSEVNRSGDRVLLVSTSDVPGMYRMRATLPGEEGHEVGLAALGLRYFSPGAVAVLAMETSRTLSNAAHLIRLLRDLSECGWVPTVRAGDTGVGMTLEAELGVDPNVNMGPDLLGIELKASRIRPSGKKVTLFAKTPAWGPGGRVQLLDEHGYWDPARDRLALYHSIYGHRESESGWKLLIDRSAGRLYVTRHGVPVVHWELSTIAERLAEKHSESVFVEARARGAGTAEQFHFVRALHVSDPSVERFLRLIEDGRICHDFAMHRSSTGSVRDHGFLFRITDGFQPGLFASVREYDLTSDAIGARL